MPWILPTLLLAVLPAAAGAQAPPAAGAPAAPAATQAATAGPDALATAKERLSYAMGMDLGHQLKTRSVEIDPAVFARGLADALSGSKTLLTEQEAKTVIADLQKAMLVQQAAAARAAGEKNKAEGDAFLAENKKKEGVVTLPSGLQYKVVTEGSGAKPGAADTVSVNYRGTLIDGTEFDSSYKRGQPVTFPVKGVIAGWTEALQLMKAGSKWQLFIPANLAYGERGAPPVIGPHATLIFEVELLEVKPASK